MQLIRGLPASDLFPHGCVVTVGNFDGVHRGHQAVLQQAADLAEGASLPLAVLTFEPLPREFFRPDTPVARLTRLRERVCFIRELGAEHPIVEALIVLRFTRTLAAMSAEDFVRHIFVDTLKARQIVIGDDFRFGQGRQGDFTLLESMGARYGFGVRAAKTVQVDGARVSSTRIRAHLAERDVVGAARLLGRPVTLCGRVTHGDKRGRQLGFPTANVALNRRLSPLRGVFAVEAALPDGTRHRGVANVGTRPTVSGGDARLEVHLFDFDRDIYGQILRVTFRHPLRDEQKFDSLDALVAQIRQDERAAKQWFLAQPRL